VNRAVAGTAALFLAAATAIAAEPSIEAVNAWINEPPPGVGIAAAYMDLRNTTQEPMFLAGASGAPFERVEMHETTVRDGTTSMRRLEQVEIPAGGTVSFAPGGKHFMLFGKPPLPRAGEHVSMRLRFADGGGLELKVPVRGPRSQ
jgi:hypothetical protein